jgi:hypothetical protein
VEAERFIPWAIGGAAILAFVLSRGGSSSGPGFTVVETGGDFGARVAAAEVYRDLQLGTLADSTTRLQIEASRDTAMQALNVSAELGRLEAQTQRRALEESASVRRAELAETGALARAQVDSQNRAVAAQERTNILGSFLSVVGSIVGSVLGLSGDGAYYAALESAGAEPIHARTQWSLVSRGAS